jgi:hypothetical protein
MFDSGSMSKLFWIFGFLLDFLVQSNNPIKFIEPESNLNQLFDFFGFFEFVQSSIRSKIQKKVYSPILDKTSH